MATRLELQSELEEILGSPEVYYQPPSNKTLKYPCIIYDLSNTDVIPADNRKYIKTNRYHVKHLYKSLTNELKDTILDRFMMISHNNRMKVDGIYNDDFTLYF